MADPDNTQLADLRPAFLRETHDPPLIDPLKARIEQWYNHE
jgi:hypothetical protein